MFADRNCSFGDEICDKSKDVGWEENSNSDYGDQEDMIFNDLQLFFHAIEEPQLIDYFIKNRVTLGQLLEFDEQDLINCGIECVGDRKKILANTVQMHCEKWQPSSLHDLTVKSLLSSPGIYVTLNDINKHLEYIGVTAKYLTRRLQMDPKILELGKDYVGIGKISSELEDLMKTVKTMNGQFSCLRKELNKNKKDLTLRPAYQPGSGNWQTTHITNRILSILLAGVAFSITLRFGKRLVTIL